MKIKPEYRQDRVQDACDPPPDPHKAQQNAGSFQHVVQRRCIIQPDLKGTDYKEQASMPSANTRIHALESRQKQETGKVETKSEHRIASIERIFRELGMTLRTEPKLGMEYSAILCIPTSNQSDFSAKVSLVNNLLNIEIRGSEVELTKRLCDRIGKIQSALQREQIQIRITWLSSDCCDEKMHDHSDDLKSFGEIQDEG